MLSGPTPMMPEAMSSATAHATPGPVNPKGQPNLSTNAKSPSLVKQALNKITQCSSRQTEITCMITHINTISEEELPVCIVLHIGLWYCCLNCAPSYV